MWEVWRFGNMNEFSFVVIKEPCSEYFYNLTGRAQKTYQFSGHE